MQANAVYRGSYILIQHMSDRENLDEKIERLESEQEDLKDTVSKMLPSRRSVLKGAATAAGAGAIGFSAGNASADASMADEDGNIGTPSDRVDIFADGIDANSITQSSSVDADQIDGYDVVKDGVDGTGTINFKTS